VSRAASRSASRATAPLAAIAGALRRERQRVGLSLTELARRAGIAKSTLSQLEAATGNPSIETLWALAVALDVPFSRLVEPPAPHVLVVRSGQGPAIPSETGHFAGTLLPSCPPGARRDLYVIALEPGEPRRAEPHIRGSVEHLVVGAGRVRVGPVDAPVELGPGDYARFPGDLPHVYEALTPASSAVLVMEHV
jgi:transcriptional regulator with XRE-family HTH domain